MEADWSVALAAGDPAIIVPWAASPEDVQQCKFLNLRLNPSLIDEIAEARCRPALRAALLLLNGATSPFWTAKCDAWASSVDEGAEPYDPYEMGTEPGETLFGAGSYVDLVARDGAFFLSFERQERWLREITQTLRVIPSNAARVDFVLRRAEVDSAPGFAVTWFVEGCGSTGQRAAQAWGEAFDRALGVILAWRTPVDGTISGAGE